MKTLTYSISISILLIIGLSACNSNNTQSAVQTTETTERQLSPALFIDSAKSYAQATQMQLSSNLMATMTQSGPVGAISFCNERAIELTDSMSINFGISIKRVSDKPRNPNNAANKDELEFIQSIKTELKNGGQPTPVYHALENSNTTYLPILTNGLCLKCHGVESKDINSETLSKLDELYPKDLARGYNLNELRGIWVIDIPK